MSKQEVTGRTKEQLEELRREHESYDRDKAFEEHYCLAKIPRQPDDYDGPQRYCINQKVKPHGSNYLCKYHCGNAPLADHTDRESPVTNMKHGMHATQKHLLEDFDEKDEALYKWIVDEWPDAYDIDIENDPNAAYDLHRLGVEIVRAERGRGYIIEEGEVKEQDRVTDDGNVVVDEDGEVVTEKSEHYLSGMLHRQDNKITKLEQELGISRKERLRQDSTDEAVDAIKGFTELGGAFLDRESKDYDPDESPWEND